MHKVVAVGPTSNVSPSFARLFFFVFLVGPVWRWVLEKFPGQQCFCLSINIFFLKIKKFFFNRRFFHIFVFCLVGSNFKMNWKVIFQLFLFNMEWDRVIFHNLTWCKIELFSIIEKSRNNFPILYDITKYIKT